MDSPLETGGKMGQVFVQTQRGRLRGDNTPYYFTFLSHKAQCRPKGLH